MVLVVVAVQSGVVVSVVQVVTVEVDSTPQSSQKCSSLQSSSEQKHVTASETGAPMAMSIPSGIPLPQGIHRSLFSPQDQTLTSSPSIAEY